MTPIQVVSLLIKYNLNFVFLKDNEIPIYDEEFIKENNIKTYPNEEVLSGIKELGTFEVVDELSDYDDRVNTEIIIIHFKDFGFYIREERGVLDDGEETGCEYYIVEPIGTQIIFGNKNIVK